MPKTVASSVPHLPRPAPPFEYRQIFLIPFGIEVSKRNIWIAGYNTNAYIGTVSGNGVWAINFDNQNGLRWIRKFSGPLSAEGCFFSRNDALSIVCSNDTFQPATVVEELLIENSDGSGTRRDLSPSKSEFLLLRFPFHDSDDRTAIFARRDYSSPAEQLVTMEDGWVHRWEPTSATLPPSFPSHAQILRWNLATRPIRHAAGIVLVFNVSIFMQRSGDLRGGVVVVMLTDSYQTLWTSAIADLDIDYQAGGCDSDGLDNIFVAINRSSHFSSERNSCIHKIDASGAEIVNGWPQVLDHTANLEVTGVSVSNRNVFACGRFMKSTFDYSPFVASFKFDGSSSSLFGMRFRENQEEWHHVYIAAQGDYFFLAGYCIDTSDPNDYRHYLQLGKYDRYGILA